MAILHVSSNISLSSLNDKDVVLVDASSGAVIITLPYVIEISEIIIQKIDLTTNAVVLQTRGPFDKIEEGSSYIISEANTNAVLVSDRKSKFYLKGGVDNGELPVGSDGAVHLYVNVSGSDSNDGQTSGSAFRTIQKAFDRSLKWFDLCITGTDCVLEVGDGIYSGSVLNLKYPLVSRFIVRGNEETQAILFSGTVTSGSGCTITDSTANFGISKNIVGLNLRIWDPNNEAATKQWHQIAEHTNTVIKTSFTTTFHAVPTVGWLYRVCRPNVRVIGSGKPCFNLNLGGRYDSVQGAHTAIGAGGKSVLLSFIQVERNDSFFDEAIIVNGGCIGTQGVVSSGSSVALYAHNSSVIMIGVSSDLLDDPVMHVSAANYSFYGASLGIRRFPAGGVYALWFVQSVAQGHPIVWGSHAIGLEDYSQGFFFGGSVFDGGIHVDRRSWTRIGSGFDSETPFLVSGSPASQPGIKVTADSFCELQDRINFKGCLTGAIYTDQSRLSIGSNSITGSGIIGFGIDIQHGSMCRIASGISITGSLGQIRVDTTIGTFSSLTIGSPVTGANSGARVWRDV